MLKVLTWNILHGGGPQRVPEICLALLGHGADVLVLTEYRERRGGSLRGVLADHGYPHQRLAGGVLGNGILVASRHRLGECGAGAPEARAGRWLACRVPEFEVELAAVHVPDDSDLAAKKAFWGFLVAYARARSAERAVVLGDYNTGRGGMDSEGGRFGCERMLGAFEQAGFRDAWRLKNPVSREFSWVSHQGKGFRIDGAYLSPPLHGLLQTAFYSQVERELGMSDHALMTLELALERGESGASGGVFAGLFGGSASASAAENL